MRWIVSAVLLMVGVLHLLPLVGVVSRAQLTRLYGVEVDTPTLELLLRHRAVLFGLLGAFLLVAAFRAPLQWAAWWPRRSASASFLVLAWLVPGAQSHPAIALVVRLDWIALALVLRDDRARRADAQLTA
jgi:hypothetical protein